MDAIDFIREKRRMCRLISDCHACPLFKHCDNLEDDNYEIAKEAVEIVEEWSISHPRKTRQTEILKLYPNATLDRHNTLGIAPCTLEKDMDKECDHDCEECFLRFWREEID